MAYFQQVHSSLAAWCRYLDRPRVALRAVIVLLSIHSGFLAYSAYVHSPTLNEPGHLVAGLSHWKLGRFELYRVNPPLVRMVAALPVTAVGYEEDWSGFYEGPGARPVFNMGEDFVAANGERSFFLFMIARWACIPFSWIGGIICYLWARDLYGRSSGVIACTLWCFSPNILGHASLITADAHASALGLAACYTFWRWLKKPTWSQAALTGMVLGLAELSKTTLILFYPLWPLLWLIYRWPDRECTNIQQWCREAGMLLLRMAIGLYVLSVGYGFEGTGKQLKEFHFVSSLFTEQRDTLEADLPSSEKLVTSDPFSNRFVDSLLGTVPVPFPENYLRGIDIQRRDFEDYSSPFYLAGQWQDYGWWYYYLYACAIKVPVGTWLLTIGVLVCKIFVRQRSMQLRDECILIFPGILVFAVVSANMGINEHLRYVLPCFPFAFIWISQIANCFSYNANKFEGSLMRLDNSTFPVLAASIFLLWSVSSSLWIYPHSLSYFNEVIGGPLNGSKHLLNSNIDWGQDLRYLRWSKLDQSDKLQERYFYLAYFGFFEPADVGFTVTQSWPQEKSPNEPDEMSTYSANKTRQPPPGIYAISLNLLHGHPWPVRGSNSLVREEYHASFNDLRENDSFENIGYSIRVYDQR